MGIIYVRQKSSKRKKSKKPRKPTLPKLKGMVEFFPDLSISNKCASMSNSIPANGTKSPDMLKADFANKNYTIAPAYNKGAYQVVPKNEIQSIGKK